MDRRARRVRALLLRRQAVLTEADLKELQLDGDVTEFHDMIKKLRDHYASRHLNPRESFTIGVAQSNDGSPTGVAVVSTPRPLVDDTTVRLLGRVAYALSGPARRPHRRRRRTTCWARPSKLSPNDLSRCRSCIVDAPDGGAVTGPTPQVLVGTGYPPASRSPRR